MPVKCVLSMRLSYFLCKKDSHDALRSSAYEMPGK